MPHAKSDSQLDEILKEIFTPLSSQKSYSVDSLLEEVFELADTPTAPAATPALPTLPVSENKKIRSLNPLFLGLSLALGIFIGGLSGFYLGKSHGIIQEIHYWMSEKPHEIIEPIKSPSEMEKLAPSELT